MLGNTASSSQKANPLDLVQLKKLYDSGANISMGKKTNLVIKDEDANDSQSSQEEESKEPKEDHIMSKVKSKAKARTKEDLMKRLAEKKRELLMRQYGTTNEEQND